MTAVTAAERTFTTERALAERTLTGRLLLRHGGTRRGGSIVVRAGLRLLPGLRTGTTVRRGAAVATEVRPAAEFGGDEVRTAGVKIDGGDVDLDLVADLPGRLAG